VVSSDKIFIRFHENPRNDSKLLMEIYRLTICPYLSLWNNKRRTGIKM